MMWAALDVVTILVAGFMVGNELAIAAFVHPAFWRLSDSAHAEAAGALARVLGRVMPFWYGLGLALILGSAFVHHGETGHWQVLIVVAAVLWALVIAATVVALVPINNRVASWTDATRPADWKRDRRRWDSLHRLRVALLAVSFGLFVVGASGRI